MVLMAMTFLLMSVMMLLSLVLRVDADYVARIKADDVEAMVFQVTDYRANM